MQILNTRCFAALFVCSLALLLAACGGDDPQEFDAGMLGAVEIAPGDAIQIRTLLTHSVEAEISLPMRRSAELAISDYGTIHGHAIELGDSLDSRCSPEGGKAGALEIVADLENIVGVIGTACSAAAVEASPILSGAGLVMISPSNTSPSLTSDLAGNPNPDYYPGYYRTASNDLHQAAIAANFAYHELGLSSVATVDDGDPYTMALTTAFKHAFEKLPGPDSFELPYVTHQIHIAKGQTDMGHILDRITGGGDPRGMADGIFFPIFTEEGIPFIQQARTFQSVEANLKNTTFITGTGLLIPSFLELPESQGVYLVGPSPLDTSNVNQATGMNVVQVLANYQSMYGSPETPYWAHAYDAMTLLLSAIESVAVDIGGTLYVDRALLRQALTDTEDFDGLLGPLSCDDFGDCGTGEISIYHHTDPSITDPADLDPVYPFEL